jgi:anti-anti-sigma factor
VGPGRIEAEKIGGAVVISVIGEHDLNTAPELRESLDAAIGGSSAVVVDLSPADFIDSSVIKVIIEMRGRARESGTGFAVALAGGGEPAVRRVLEVTDLMERLPVVPDRAEAIQQATAGAGR